MYILCIFALFFHCYHLFCHFSVLLAAIESAHHYHRCISICGLSNDCCIYDVCLKYSSRRKFLALLVMSLWRCHAARVYFSDAIRSVWLTVQTEYVGHRVATQLIYLQIDKLCVNWLKIVICFCYSHAFATCVCIPALRNIFEKG